MPRSVLLTLSLAVVLVGALAIIAHAGRKTSTHLIYRTTFLAALTEGRIRNVPVFVSRHKDECGRCRRQHEKVLTNRAFVKWANEHLVVAIAHNEMLHDPVEEKGEGGETVESCPLYPGMTCREHVHMAVDVDNGRGEDLVRVPFLELCPNSWLVLPDGKVVRIREQDQFDPKRIREIVTEHQKTLGDALSHADSGVLQALVDAARAAYDDEDWMAGLTAWSAIAERVPEPSPSLKRMVTKALAEMDEDVEIAADDFLSAEPEEIGAEEIEAAKALLAATDVEVYGAYLPVRALIARWLAER